MTAMERGKEIALDAADIILFADRRIGELTAETAALSRKESGARKGSPAGGPPSKSEALAEAGISKQRAKKSTDFNHAKVKGIAGSREIVGRGRLTPR